MTGQYPKRRETDAEAKLRNDQLDLARRQREGEERRARTEEPPLNVVSDDGKTIRLGPIKPPKTWQGRPRSKPHG